MGASRDCTGVYSEVGSEGVSAAISVLCVFVWRRYGADPAGDGKALAARGWRCNAGFSVIMPNNYVLFPGFDVDSKELEKKKLAEAVPALEKVSRLITGRETVFACKEGSLPFIKTRIINPLFVRYQMSPKPFHATSECIGCKRCEKSCPVGNITMKERRPVWGKNCTACLACYHVCPQHAVQYGKKTKGKGHYFNPDSAY